AILREYARNSTRQAVRAVIGRQHDGDVGCADLRNGVHRPRSISRTSRIPAGVWLRAAETASATLVITPVGTPRAGAQPVACLTPELSTNCCGRNWFSAIAGAEPASKASP